MNTPNKPSIIVSTAVRKPLEKVWSCWNEPQHVVHWNFASDDWCCPGAENEFRIGGKITSRMEAKDGSTGFDFGGIYDAIIPNSLVALTLEDGRKVSVSFSEIDAVNVVVAETFEAENENPLELQRDGWQAILDNFKKYAESLT